MSLIRPCLIQSNGQMEKLALHSSKDNSSTVIEKAKYIVTKAGCYNYEENGISLWEFSSTSFGFLGEIESKAIAESEHGGANPGELEGKRYE